MESLVDARGLSCPQPVILTKKALEEGGSVTTVVDNTAALENVSRLAKTLGYEVEVEQDRAGMAHRYVLELPDLCPECRDISRATR